MKKRLVSILLTLSMVVGLGTPSLAMDNDATMQEFDDINAYNEVTVFTETMGRALSMTLQERVEEAKAGIMALDLENQGLSYIQEACLTELDSIAQMDGAILHEYSVLLPTARAATPTYYGTDHGTDFYSSLTSKKTISKKKNEITNFETLKFIGSTGGSILLCFEAAPVIGLLWTVLTASWPKGYETHDGDHVENWILVAPINRAIYAKETLGYKLVYNREYGELQPFSVYYYNAILPSGEQHAKDVEYGTYYVSDLSGTKKTDVLRLCYDCYINMNPVISFTLWDSSTFRWPTK